MHRSAPAALTLVLATALTACGDDSDDSSPDAATTGTAVGEAPAGAPAVRVESPRDIAELLGCTGSYRDEPAGAPLVESAGTCEVAGDEERVRLLTFATGEDQTAYIQESVGLDRVFSGGDGWLVQSASRPADSAVREALGWKKEA